MNIDNNNTLTTQSDQPVVLPDNLLDHIVVAKYHDAVACIGLVIGDSLYHDQLVQIALMEDIESTDYSYILPKKKNDRIIIFKKDIMVAVHSDEVTGVVPSVE